MKELKKKIINAIAKGWPTPFPKSYKEACRHEVRDDLANFVRIELEEGVDWDLERKDLIFENIRHVINMAQTDLERTLDAVEKIEKEELDIDTDELVDFIIDQMPENVGC